LGERRKFGIVRSAVSERTSMCCSAVIARVAIRSGTIAGLPLKVYKRTKDGREEAPTIGCSRCFR
jgi:phage portal protein BeeE